jgi:putative aldouronate transport system substrate-binding protein
MVTPKSPTESTILPPLFFDEQQSAELADLSKTINDYVEQMIASFVTGSAPMVIREVNGFMNLQR